MLLKYGAGLLELFSSVSCKTQGRDNVPLEENLVLVEGHTRKRRGCYMYSSWRVVSQKIRSVDLE